MVMSKHEWSQDLQRFYDTMPTWWWSSAERERHYQAYKEARLCREKEKIKSNEG